jgi:hypothetical protein
LKDKRKRWEIAGPLVHYWIYIKSLRGSGITIIDLKAREIATATGVTASYGLNRGRNTSRRTGEKSIHHIATADDDFTTLADVSMWSPVVK